MGWSAQNNNLTIVRRSASHAVLDALRPIFSARRSANL
ncbi:Glycosidase [Pseudomonas syringae pv. actinidiae]|uniref:Glycosidase n=1 Tax=Pseudomonas syringae pv. actinidiae TaxID=103796 RepID=A0A2V0QWL3_PSESF|nr:Glycosidase [Pseudomonas syringae pv. actinidiae]GBH15080.1 Glycosidase [Pseudomonas syringae pv. actinidiae]